MSDPIYRPEHTALLFVDPYNDFLSEGGKLWPNVAAIAEEVRLLDNLRTVVAEVRRAGIRVFIVPHRRWVHRRLLAECGRVSHRSEPTLCVKPDAPPQWDRAAL